MSCVTPKVTQAYGFKLTRTISDTSTKCNFTSRSRTVTKMATPPLAPFFHVKYGFGACLLESFRV